MSESNGRALTSARVRAAAEAGHREVPVTAHALVTPLARDTARELGVVLLSPGAPAGARAERGAPSADAPARGDPAGEGLEARVRAIVAGLVGSAPPAPARPGKAATVRHVDGRDVTLQPFPYDGPEPGQDVRIADVVTSADGAPMAAGFLTLSRGCFPWTLSYDEVEYVVEGELHIGLASGTVVGRAGDVLFIPKGTAITFGTPSWAKLLYVTFPADWEAGLS
jgi:ethanolamine utilization protein EutQ